MEDSTVLAKLNTESVRIELAYELGVLTHGARDDLRSIAKIRNIFAHSVADASCSFEDAAVKTLCAKLSPARSEQQFVELRKLLGYENADSRSYFVEALTASALEIMWRLDSQGIHRLEPADPPAEPVAVQMLRDTVAVWQRMGVNVEMFVGDT